ncbi:hypothetical protein ACK8HX_07095 [Oryzobacter sp. R7]|uniref:hypothetical protein n=1 Tax=Oryzobacter faecalis TaxID=3388656 RepID=UPI00398CF509
MPGTRRDVVEARRWATARRWAVGVLTLASVALAGWLALVLVAASLVVRAVEVVRPGSPPGGVDGVGIAADVLPGVFLGWCTGLAATATLARGDALGARANGVTGALLGVVAGALVLRLTGVL